MTFWATLGKRKRDRQKRLEREEEEKLLLQLAEISKAWSGARSALHRGYRQPVNRQAAYDLAHTPRKPRG